MNSKRFVKDLLERVASTYLQCFLGLLIVAGPLNIDAISVALVSAIPATLAVLKAALASRVGEKGTASLLPGLPILGE